MEAQTKLQKGLQKSIAIKEFGNPDVFTLAEINIPEVGYGQVLIEVKASSVNPVDYKIRQGLAPGLSPAFPAILHGDVSGVISAVGTGVLDFKIGDEVYGNIGGITQTQGALSQWALADARLVAKKPSNLNFLEAAALPLVSITAWEALVDRIQIQPGDRVLIHGGAGGVGHIALQIARIQGARVHVTVSSESKAEIAKSLGADQVIDYRKESVAEYVQRLTEGKGYDVVFDTIGGENLDRSFEAARVGGQVASISTHSKHDLSLLHQKGLSLHVILMLIPLIHGTGREHHGEILRRVSALAEQGRIKPVLDSRQYGFTQVSQAHAQLESGKSVGKIVLKNDL